MSNVLVVAEHANGALSKATLTCVRFAQQAAKRTGGEVHGLVSGHGIDPVAQELARYVGTVHVADAEALAHELAEAKAQAIVSAAQACNAAIVCQAATAHGKDTLPRAAALANAGMASDIVGFADDSSLQFVRPIQAGNILAVCEIETDLKYISTRPTDFDAAEPLDGPGAPRLWLLSSPPSRRVLKNLLALNPIARSSRKLQASSRGVEALKKLKVSPSLLNPSLINSAQRSVPHAQLSTPAGSPTTCRWGKPAKLSRPICTSPWGSRARFSTSRV